MTLDGFFYWFGVVSFFAHGLAAAVATAWWLVDRAIGRTKLAREMIAAYEEALKRRQQAKEPPGA